jgi:predicted nucleotidyltransferase
MGNNNVKCILCNGEVAEMTVVEGQVSDLVRQIVDQVHPLRVMLFGSAARGEWQPGSDLDILIVMPEGSLRRQTAKNLYRVIQDITIPFDLIVVTPGDLEKHRHNPGLIYHTILEEGQTLYAA